MRLKKNKTNKSKKLNRMFWVIVGVFVLGGVYLTISTANAGAKLAYLEEIEAQLMDENRRLKGELIKLNSLKVLESRAEELGYTQPTKLIYLSEQESVAKAP